MPIPPALLWDAGPHGEASIVFDVEHATVVLTPRGQGMALGGGASSPACGWPSGERLGPFPRPSPSYASSPLP